MSDAPEYAIIYALSAQVTEDSYKVFTHVLKCAPTTTLAEIFAWKERMGKGCTPISLHIETLETLP